MLLAVNNFSDAANMCNRERRPSFIVPAPPGHGYPAGVLALTRAQGRLSRAMLGPRRLALLSLLGNVVLVGLLVMRGAPQTSLLRCPPTPPPPLGGRAAP